MTINGEETSNMYYLSHYGEYFFFLLNGSSHRLIDTLEQSTDGHAIPAMAAGCRLIDALEQSTDDHAIPAMAAGCRLINALEQPTNDHSIPAMATGCQLIDG